MFVEAFLVDDLLGEDVSAAKEYLSVVSMQVNMKDNRAIRTALATLAVSNGCLASLAWYLGGFSTRYRIFTADLG